MLLEAPAGKIDDGETPEATMRRELVEELGHKIERLDLIVTLYSTPGSVTERLWLFTGEYSDATKVAPGGGEDAESERLDIVELTLDDALGMVADGRIVDMKTVVLLQWMRRDDAPRRAGRRRCRNGQRRFARQGLVQQRAAHGERCSQDANRAPSGPAPSRTPGFALSIAGHGRPRPRRYEMPTKSANVKNKKQYEALKDKGMSKERAAKIANSPKASKHGGEKSHSGSGKRNQGGTTAQHKAGGAQGWQGGGKEEVVAGVLPVGRPAHSNSCDCPTCRRPAGKLHS